MRWFSKKNALAHRPFLVVILFLFGVCLFSVGFVFLWIALSPAPDITSFANREVVQSTKIFDRTGQVLLYDYNRDARRDVVPLSGISKNAINATIAIEDASFYEHGGVRLKSFVRAMIADLMGGSLSQGGSTITQQVVKNTLLTSKKSIVRKAHEWLLAIKLEEAYPKDAILETYLNEIPYGGTLYGIESASEAYFGTTAKDLTLAQGAYLAAMIQAPTHYSPYGPNRTELEARKNLVLLRMKDLRFISEEQYAATLKETVAFSTQRKTAIIAPHFVFYVIDYLRQKYGERALVSGLTVITTLDSDLQTHAEEIVNRRALENEKNFKASNAAMVALDPTTGQILTMIGSRDFFDTAIDGQFNATLSLRQPGSTFKPFIYALALLKGYTRDTVVFDVPTQFSTYCSPMEIASDTPPCYAPQNFDGKFRGPMTFETALAQSINIPALKTLYLVGVGNAVAFSKAFGLTTLGDQDQYGLTLVLGGGEVRLLDITSAFGVFANDGVRTPPVGILEVSDTEGVPLESYAPDPTQVIPDNIARDMSAMLSDNPARVPTYTINSPLYFPGYDVAVKTGTTNDTRDTWVIGYTPSIVIGTWAGNNNNTPMVKSIAGYIVVPMWHEVMEYALSKYPKSYFGEPTPIYSSVPPMLRGNWKIPDGNGQIIPHDLLHWVDKHNPTGPPPNDPQSDSQYAYWEYGVSMWFGSHPEALYTPLPPPPVPLSNPPQTTESLPQQSISL